MKRDFPKVLLIQLLIVLLFQLEAFSAPQKLVVYTYSSFPVSSIENIKDHFLKKYQTKVDFRAFSDTGPIFNQLLQEKRAPQADLVIGLDNNYFSKAIEQDLFQSYQPKAANKIRPELIFDPQYRMIPFDYGYVVFNYDRERLGKVPKTHRDLLDPYYKGKIIIENPLTSSPGQVFLLTTIALYGEDGYLDYWRRLKKNLLTITPGWDEAYGIYTAGEAPLVLSYGTSPVYHYLYDKTERYRALVLDDAAYAQIEGMGIVKGSTNLKGARQLVDYILTPEFQSLIPESQFMYPVTTDAKLPESFKVAAQVKRILNLPLDQVAAKLDKWLNDWEKAVNR
jgi:thiamine transport system substrate-binding protein